MQWGLLRAIQGVLNAVGIPTCCTGTPECFIGAPGCHRDHPTQGNPWRAPPIPNPIGFSHQSWAQSQFLPGPKEAEDAVRGYGAAGAPTP